MVILEAAVCEKLLNCISLRGRLISNTSSTDLGWPVLEILLSKTQHNTIQMHQIPLDKIQHYQVACE